MKRNSRADGTSRNECSRSEAALKKESQELLIGPIAGKQSARRSDLSSDLQSPLGLDFVDRGQDLGNDLPLDFQFMLPPPPESDIKNKIEFLDSLLRMGEEPYEIEMEVIFVADDVSRHFHCWLVSQGLDLGEMCVRELVGHYFEFVYLKNWKRNASLSKISKKQLADYFPLVIDGAIVKSTLGAITKYDLIALLYMFLGWQMPGLPAMRIVRCCWGMRLGEERRARREMRKDRESRVSSPFAGSRSKDAAATAGGKLH